MKALAILPVLEFPLLWLLLRSKRCGLRDAALYAASYWGFILFAITELTSLGHHLDRSTLGLAWLTANMVTFAILWRYRDSLEIPSFATLARAFRTISPGLQLLTVGSALLVLAVGVTAILSPPNSIDVIDYHISRVALWTSNRSVAFFPTNDYVQLVYAVWAEYAALNFTILFGSDRLVNLVEFASFLGLIVCTSAIARELGAGAKGQVLAAIITATLPTALTESSGATNGVVISFWFVTAVFCALRLSSEDYPYALTAGAAAVGLTIATKGTGFVVLPGVLAACFLARYRIRKEWLLRDGLVFATIVVILNAPPSLRNYNLTGNPLGTNFAGGGAHLDASVGRISVRDSAANLLRNLALQFTLTEKATDEVEQYTVKAIRWLGADPDDPDFIWRRIDNANGYGFEVQSFNRNETYAGNPLQILMLLGALVLCAIVPISRRRDVVLYALGIVISALLFSALLRWQRWGARLELPILILGVPLLAVVLEATLRPTVIVGIVAMLVVTSVPCVVANEYRPLLFSSLSPRELRTRPFAGNLFTKSRDAFYFEDHHRDLFHSYVDASRFVQSTGCKDVGIDTTFEHYEYPAMAFLGFAEGNVHLRYTGIRNLTAKYIDPAEKPPCAVICFACSRSRAKAEAYTTTGTKTAIFGNAVVFYGNIRDTKRTDRNSDCGRRSQGRPGRNSCVLAKAKRLPPVRIAALFGALYGRPAKGQGIPKSN
ncbi:MAG TPA: hypothetical protein VMT61_00740 [Candidatus Binataceae bacterium]|nr:hypothetical protein [Candidatus Binataceae bacterium]